MAGFFELAVIGPIAGPRFGLVDACADCTRRDSRTGDCHGFGPGCLGARRAEPTRTAEDRQAARLAITE